MIYLLRFSAGFFGVITLVGWVRMVTWVGGRGKKR